MKIILIIKLTAGAAKLAIDTGKLIYKVVEHASKVELLSNLDYIGVLPEVTLSQIQEEINQNHAMVGSILKNPSIVGKLILTSFENQFKEIDSSLNKGDYFGSGKQIETKISKKFLESLPEMQKCKVDRGISTVVIPTESLDILSKPEFLNYPYNTFKLNNPKP